MPRALWKGAISFGLVTIPVGLHSAVEPRGGLHFRLLHAEDDSPIDYRRYCEAEDVEVPWKEIVKGYEHERGQFVVMSDGDFEKAAAAVPSSQVFEIREFVEVAAIPARHFEQPYYVAPGGRGAGKPYALLRDALAETGRAGIGKIVLRQREHLAALQASGEALVLTTLRFADELRDAGTLDLPDRGEGWTKKEMALARNLIDALAAEWDAGKYRDEYEAVLRQIIDRKVKGEEIVVPKAERPRPVRDLMTALKESLEKGRREPAPASRALRAVAGGRRGRGSAPRRTAARRRTTAA
jgi:DNA end-binding protein Ku